MNKYNRLLDQIAAEYSIRRGSSESISDWKIRIIYSVLGQMALASLQDTPEDEEPSIVHVKRRIEAVLISYGEMYPELHAYIPDDASTVSDEIYNIFNSTGHFYHKAHHVSAAMKSSSASLDVVFTRGYELEMRQKVSGIGTYILNDSATNSGTIEKMFQLNQADLKNQWKDCLSGVSWKEFTALDQRVECLRMREPFTHGYWVNQPERSSRVSMLRVGMPGAWIYYLYTTQNEKLVVSQLPAWQVENYRYRLLANACLSEYKVLPSARYHQDGELVYIQFGYLPAPQELNLWKLYTWPTSILSLPKDFARVCTKQVFEAIRAVMIKQGYEFIEEG